jgi:hypothetical protein
MLFCEVKPEQFSDHGTEANSMKSRESRTQFGIEQLRRNESDFG